ncbi:delta-sarcoglycan [Bacillus rossius redtenbacheri]|uniref:delta-sarcoglycan n=1 Tax=Bacillus rossius redtenbacheri TaxID=93214 RepID=UPI002FDDEE29
MQISRSSMLRENNLLFPVLTSNSHSKPNDNASLNRMGRAESLASDWADDGGAATPNHQHSNHHDNHHHHPPSSGSGCRFKVGIYGWRKRCLYLLILALMVMVIVNLALTLWVLKVMEFSSEGMGHLRIVTGGVRLSGQALVLDALVASSIRSRKNQPVVVESFRNFTVNARDEAGRVANRLVLGKERLECVSRGFRVTDTRGTVLFSADKDEVLVGAEVLRVTGEGGAVFDGTVQTTMVRADSGHELRLESPTRSLEVRAPLGVLIESRAGDIAATCLTDLKLQSLAGAVRLDSSNVYLPGLRTAKPPGSGASPARQLQPPRQPRHQIYQLCVCSNGKLFLATPEGLCAADDDSLVCR